MKSRSISSTVQQRARGRHTHTQIDEIILSKAGFVKNQLELVLEYEVNNEDREGRPSKPYRCDLVRNIANHDRGPQIISASNLRQIDRVLRRNSNVEVGRGRLTTDQSGG